jgi:cell division protein ZapA (FtsZ GTPase activity inhibitor)
VTTEAFSDKDKPLDEIVIIELFGEEFRFRPEGDDMDSEKVAEYLKHHVELAEKQFQFKSSDKNKLAILLLAAMNMSKDFHELQMECSKLEAHVCQRMASLKKKIDEGMR